MADDRRTTCKSCNRHRDECGPISWRGKCGECGPRLALEAADQLHYHRGPIFVRWRRAVAASVGAVLPEDS